MNTIGLMETSTSRNEQALMLDPKARFTSSFHQMLSTYDETGRLDLECMGDCFHYMALEARHGGSLSNQGTVPDIHDLSARDFQIAYETLGHIQYDSTCDTPELIYKSDFSGRLNIHKLEMALHKLNDYYCRYVKSDTSVGDKTPIIEFYYLLSDLTGYR